MTSSIQLFKPCGIEKIKCAGSFANTTGNRSVFGLAGGGNDKGAAAKKPYEIPYKSMRSLRLDGDSPTRRFPLARNPPNRMT